MNLNYDTEEIVEEPEMLNYYQKRALSYGELMAYNNRWARYNRYVREQNDKKVLVEFPRFFENIRYLVETKMRGKDGESDSIRSIGELSGIVETEYCRGHPSGIPLPWEQLDIVENGYDGYVSVLQDIQSEWNKIVEHGEKLLKAKESKLRRDFIKAGGKISIEEAMKRSGVEPTPYVAPKPEPVQERITIADAIKKYGIEEVRYN